MTIKLQGLKQAQKAFSDRLANVKEFTPKAFTDVVLDLTGKAVELAPVKDGDLRGSGRGEINGRTVAEGKPNGSVSAKGSAPEAERLEGIVSFSTPYAVRQHEELSYKHPQGGQAKYLEEPFSKNQDKYIKNLSESVRKSVD